MHHCCRIALFALALAFGHLAQAAPGTVPVQQQPANIPAQRTEGSVLCRHAAFSDCARQGKARLVFFGDSITQGWEETGQAVWDRCLAPLGAVNFGISGDRVQHVLWRIQNGSVSGLKAKLIVIMIGTNNLNDNPELQIVEGIGMIVRELRARVPEAKILLLGIFPREEHPGELRARLNRVNAEIARLHDGRHVFYRDLGPHFLQADGSVIPGLMSDFVHLTARGYEVWAQALGPELETLMAD